MKNIVQGNGHRWTTAELKRLMQMWTEGAPVDEIAIALDSTQYAISKQVTRMRKEGIPLPRRQKGNVAARSHKPWTQEEVEYLVRRRNDRVTAEQIGQELGRTPMAINGMIAKLRQEDVPVEMLGQGVRRLWDANALKAAIVGRNVVPLKAVN